MHRDGCSLGQLKLNSIVMNHLTQKLLAANGQFVGALWARPMKTRKGIPASVTKTVRTTVQVGVDYDNRQVVQDARASGEAPKVNAGLPWGVWENFPYTITHKGERYVRLYPVKDGEGKPRACKVVYRINGVRATKAQVEAICPKSEFSSGGGTECYTLNENNLQQIKFAGKTTSRASAKQALVSLSLATVV